MSNKKVCKLCHEVAKLQESHIIPRFAIKFIRDKKLKQRFYEVFNRKRKIETLQEEWHIIRSNKDP